MRQLKYNLIVAMLILGMWAAAAYGVTWTVERDGSGDFTVIQDAVDAASDGDVIEIGAGRFDEYETIWDDGVPDYDVYVDMNGKRLSLIGSGAGVTIIGPEDPEHHQWPGRAVFIINAQQSPGLDIGGMTLEHSPWKIINAMYVGTLVVAECSMSGGGHGY